MNRQFLISFDWQFDQQQTHGMILICAMPHDLVHAIHAHVRSFGPQRVMLAALSRPLPHALAGSSTLRLGSPGSHRECTCLCASMTPLATSGGSSHTMYRLLWDSCLCYVSCSAHSDRPLLLDPQNAKPCICFPMGNIQQFICEIVLLTFQVSDL